MCAGNIILLQLTVKPNDYQMYFGSVPYTCLSVWKSGASIIISGEKLKWHNKNLNIYLTKEKVPYHVHKILHINYNLFLLWSCMSSLNSFTVTYWDIMGQIQSWVRSGVMVELNLRNFFYPKWSYGSKKGKLDTQSLFCLVNSFKILWKFLKTCNFVSSFSIALIF